jgi:hypothetical protein
MGQSIGAEKLSMVALVCSAACGVAEYGSGSQGAKLHHLSFTNNRVKTNSAR